MADVKWIKIVTDIFDDEKMLLIESLPSADSIIVIWFKLLCLAGKNNNNGVFIMSDKIAYTDEMLATIFRRDVNTVRLALKTFENYGMIEIIDGIITIPNWGKHQNFDKIEQKNAYMKEYMRDYRKKQKEKIGNNKLCENELPIDEWNEVLKFFDHKCAYCGSAEPLEQEHIIPVNNGGEFKIGNIVPVCRHCNSSKGTKYFEEWYKNSDTFDKQRYIKILEYSRKTNVSDLRKSNVSEADIDIEEDIEVDKDKEKEIEGERDKEYIPPLIPPKKGKSGSENPIKRVTSKQLLEKLLSKYNISDYLLEAVNDWIDYKKETFRFSYKEKGMDKLLQTVSESARNYGDEAVRNVIYNSISSGYQGITWNKLESSSGKYQNKTADMLQSSYDMMSEWARKKKMEENGNDV